MGFGLGLEVGAEEEEELVQLPSLRPPSCCFQHRPPCFSLPRPPPLARPHRELLPFCLKQRESWREMRGRHANGQVHSTAGQKRGRGLCSRWTPPTSKMARDCQSMPAWARRCSAIRDDLLQNNPNNINTCFCSFCYLPSYVWELSIFRKDCVKKVLNKNMLV